MAQPVVCAGVLNTCEHIQVGKFGFEWLLWNVTDFQVSVHIQCNEDDIDLETMRYCAVRRPLDDIIEDDEEGACSSPWCLSTAEQMMESFSNANELEIQHPLSILSLDKAIASTSARSSENVRFAIHL